MENIVFNYFKIIDEDGETYGVGASEVGSKNEVKLIEDLLELNFSLVKISKQEFEDYDEGDEIRNF